jgi:succinyl-CoA synthetase alpha subunit/GNAT superfamily N-acetyltransferase
VSDYFLRQAAGRLAREDKEHALGLIAMSGPDQRIIGHAMYAVTGPDRAEVAFAIADACQHQGLGTILLGELAQIASSRGIRVFEAIVLPRNHQMVAVFRDSGFPVQIHAAPDEILVEFPTEWTEKALEHFEQREWTAAVNAVHAFFRPRSVAVVGASRHRGTIGGEVFHNLVSYEFRGPVLPVNTAAPLVQDVVAYSSVEEIPGPVDLAVVVVPAEQVPGVVQACGRKRVRALVVLSAGFAETGPEGRARQQALVDTAHAAGMRLIGPNCMGVLNTDPEVRLNATFAPAPPPPGRTAFMSQSGALGLAIMDYAGSLGVGLSTFASVGNKADISGNDLIRYWAQDPNTDLILLYLESFGNPRKFSRIARRVGREKPIVAVKSGRSPAGSRATSSHTGALIAAADVTVDSLFRQCGVIRTDRLEEMFDVASLLANQPPPKGRRVAILTNAGGPGILCADACVAEGLEIRSLAESTQAGLRERRKSGGHDRVRHPRPVPGRDPDRSAGSRRRRPRCHLYSTPRHPAGGRGPRDSRGGADAEPRKAGGRCVHAVPRSAPGAPSGGSTHSVLPISGGRGDCPRPGRLVRRMAHATASAAGPVWRRATG